MADLDRGKRAAIEAAEQRADEAQAKAAKTESNRKKGEVLRKREEVIRKGEQLTNLAMRLKFSPLDEVMMLVVVEYSVVDS